MAKSPSKSLIIYDKESVSFFEVATFHLSLVRHLPEALFHGWDSLATGTAIFLFVVGLIKPALAVRIMTGWAGLSVWWSVLPLALVVFYGLLKANRQRFAALEREYARIAQETSPKLLLKVIEDPWRGVALTERYNSIVLIQGTPDSEAPLSWLMPEVRIEFDNRDTHRTRIESCVLAIRRETTDSEPEEIVLMSRLETEHGNVVNVESIFVDGREKSRIYFLKADHHLGEDWSDKFDSNTFLRIKMRSVGQREYCVDLNVDWEQAKKNEAPWEPGRLTVGVIDTC